MCYTFTYLTKYTSIHACVRTHLDLLQNSDADTQVLKQVQAHPPQPPPDSIPSTECGCSFVAFFFRVTPTAYGGSQGRVEPQVPTCATATATPDPRPTEPGQGLNPHPYGCLSDSFQLHPPQWELPGCSFESGLMCQTKINLKSLRFGHLAVEGAGCLGMAAWPEPPGTGWVVAL